VDFSQIDLSVGDKVFAAEVRAFLRDHVTEEVLQRERESGDSFDEQVHLALGAAGYLQRELIVEAGGGFSSVQARLWQLEKRRAHIPWVTWGTTALVARTVLEMASPELRDEVMPGVYSGHIRMCLGYTEPDGGSDVATCKTRAIRDDSWWVINGSKMFTTGAHHCQYVFLLTKTDPDAPKHQGLTMFLVPLDMPGIEVQGVRTVDGDRTNIVYYSDVRIDDRYRIGEVNGGWVVLRGPLDVEHGAVDADTEGLHDVSILDHQAGYMSLALDRASACVGRADQLGHRSVDNDAVAYRLGRATARVEAGLSTPNIFGRVAQAQMMRDLAPDLMDMMGSAAALTHGAVGGVDGGQSEYMYRFAPLAGIYGGTLEVFRNMIAQYALGLGKPQYSSVAR
jgi:alkylation response protein AidB-like acyl-CoA dehydrogenase